MPEQARPFALFVSEPSMSPIFLPPDIHIFTASKQPWIILPSDVPSVAEYYDRNEYWPAGAIERRRIALAQKVL
jgi:hypothetical protein